MAHVGLTKLGNDQRLFLWKSESKTNDFIIEPVYRLLKTHKILLKPVTIIESLLQNWKMNVSEVMLGHTNIKTKQEKWLLVKQVNKNKHFIQPHFNFIN